MILYRMGSLGDFVLCVGFCFVWVILYWGWFCFCVGDFVTGG